MAKKKAPEPEHAANHERWMVSYADMLTLLLALFIVMFAISKVDQVKFIQFAEGANQAFGGSGAVVMQGQGPAHAGSDGVMPQQKAAGMEGTAVQRSKIAEMAAAEKGRQQVQALERAKLEELRKRLNRELSEKGLKDAVRMVIDERGLVVNILTDDVIFESGQATFRPEGLKVLDQIAPSLKSLVNRITVEGHTDDVPIRTAQYPSNWELSQARAASVLQRLRLDGVPESQMSLAGYGEQKPLESNATETGRRNNRRVAVVVLANVPQPLAASTTTASPSPVAALSP